MTLDELIAALQGWRATYGDEAGRELMRIEAWVPDLELFVSVPMAALTTDAQGSPMVGAYNYHPDERDENYDFQDTGVRL